MINQFDTSKRKKGIKMLNLKQASYALALLAFAGHGYADTQVSGGAYGLNFSTDVQDVAYIDVAGAGYSERSESLSIEPHSPLKDGQYSYEISAVTGTKTVTGEDNGRDGASQTNQIINVVESGYFIIHQGDVLDTSNEQE